MSVTLVHHFKSQVSAVEYISPGADHTTLRVDDRLVEVEAIQVERHGADPQSGEPDAYHWPSSEEEVQAAAVVEASVLEDETTEVTVSSNDVVGFFFPLHYTLL